MGKFAVRLTVSAVTSLSSLSISPRRDAGHSLEHLCEVTLALILPIADAISGSPSVPNLIENEESI